MKRTLVFTLLVSLFLSGCSILNNDYATTSEPGNQTEKLEYALVGEPIIEHGDFFLQLYSKGAEMNSYGIFLRTEPRLLLDLGSSLTLNFFFEENNFYTVGQYLVKYDLDSSVPAISAERVEILPYLADVRVIYSHDYEHIYAEAEFWNEAESLHDAAVIIKINRDGSGYEEISRDERPK